MALQMSLAIAVMLATSACTHADHPSPKAGTTSPAIDGLLAGVPGDAMAIGFVDMDTPPWTYITGGGWIPLDEATRKSLDKELREYLDRYVGVDVSKLQHAVAFASGRAHPTGAVLVKSVGGTLKAPGATEHAGAKVWIVDPDEGLSLALRGDVVVFGDGAAVEAALDTLAGTHPSVLQDNKPLVAWLHEQTQGAAVGIAAIAPKGLPLPPQLAGLERCAVAFGRSGVRAVVDGSDAAITSLKTNIERVFAEGLGEIEREHAAAIAGDIPPPEGAGVIIAAAYAKSLFAQLAPHRDGNRLVASLDLGLGGTETMTVVAVVGVLAAVAIPAFMNYTHKSKGSEAQLTLNRIAKTLKVYYAVNGKLPTGDVPLTPSDSCCYGPNHKCAGGPTEWQDPIWKELDVEIDEPHLMQYRYHSDGSAAVVEAIGDLDCDGDTGAWKLDVTTAGGGVSSTITRPVPPHK
jgi:type IV pilus assembly protein PilA